MTRSRVVRGMKIFLVVIVAVSGFSGLVMWLWNALMPALFGWKLLSFWQALGLLLLSRLLFGRLGRPGGGGPWRGMGNHWATMTSQEREQFRAKWRRAGCWGAPPEPQAPQNGAPSASGPT